MSTTIRSLVALRRALRLSSTLALAGLIAGCNTLGREPSVTGSVPQDGYRSRHPIVVEQSREVFDVPVNAHGTPLSPQLRTAVENFGNDARENRVVTITMMMPKGSTNEAAAQRAGRDIIAALGDAGFAANSVTKVSYAAEGPEDAAPIRLTYPRLLARVPHRCGQWPEQVIGDTTNSDYWNFGCATQANLAAMVAEPTDLVAPSPIGKGDATRRSTIVYAYRKGEKTRSEFKLPKINASQVGGSGGGE